MVCNGRGIYGVLGASWVLIDYNICPPGIVAFEAHGATVYSHVRARLSEWQVKLTDDTHSNIAIYIYIYMYIYIYIIYMAAPPVCRSAQNDMCVCVANFNLERRPRPTRPQTEP